jgi:hypothetical protein
MQQLFQDSLAIGLYCCSINLFITVTANPCWPEITCKLKEGEHAKDCPNITTHVFQLKKKAILDNILKHGIFGQTAAHVYTIEFQKCGLPHMHLLIFLHPQDKIQTPKDVDSCIRAYWPDPITEPLLFEIVQRCMVHGPCGELNPRALCMENGKCTKQYPRPFQDTTQMNTKGYPEYWTPDDGCKYRVGTHMVDNSWIIPYKAYLSARYNCHINVKTLVLFAALKYITKYIHKGPDQATVHVEDGNKINKYIDSRYVSSCEATFCLLQFDLHHHSPSVTRLQVSQCQCNLIFSAETDPVFQVHLPGQHIVCFDPNENLQTVLERAANKVTTLTAFFAANANEGVAGETARCYMYQELLQHFVFNQNTKQWTIWQQGHTIEHMYYVLPTAGEWFYLQMLLSIIQGPQSFIDLCTHLGVTYPTFHDTCLACGLLEDNGEWQQCLDKAANMQTGLQLQQLFVMLLVFCQPSQPKALWNQYVMSICNNLCCQHMQNGIQDPSDDTIRDDGLFLVNELLHDYGSSLEKFPSMPQSKCDWQALSKNPYITKQLVYNPTAKIALANEQEPLLNCNQHHAYQEITALAREEAN